jgi:hypothetical protein
LGKGKKEGRGGREREREKRVREVSPSLRPLVLDVGAR